MWGPGMEAKSVPGLFFLKEQAVENNLLTDRQVAILSFIARRIDRDGTQPSIRELCKRFKIKSPNGIQCHLNALRKRGVVYGRGGARAVKFDWRRFV